MNYKISKMIRIKIIIHLIEKKVKIKSRIVITSTKGLKVVIKIKMKMMT
jgi:hypothetical protein